MARAFYQVEEFDNSLESELKVFEHEPHNAESAFKIGNIFSDKGNYTEASKYFKKMLDIDPTNTTAYYEQAFALTNIHLNHEAIKNLFKVIDLDPKYQKAYFILGYNYN